MADSPHLAVFTKGGAGSDPHSSFQAGWMHALFLATLFHHTQWGWFWSPFKQGGCMLCSWQLSSHSVGLVLIPIHAGWVHALFLATLFTLGEAGSDPPQLISLQGGCMFCYRQLFFFTLGGAGSIIRNKRLYLVATLSIAATGLCMQHLDHGLTMQYLIKTPINRPWPLLP